MALNAWWTVDVLNYNGIKLTAIMRVYQEAWFLDDQVGGTVSQLFAFAKL